MSMWCNNLEKCHLHRERIISIELHREELVEWLGKGNDDAGSRALRKVQIKPLEKLI